MVSNFYLLLYLVFDDNRFNYRYPFFNFFILFINILQNSFNCNLIKQKSNSFNCNLIKQKSKKIACKEIYKVSRDIVEYVILKFLESKYNSPIDIYDPFILNNFVTICIFSLLLFIFL